MSPIDIPTCAATTPNLMMDQVIHTDADTPLTGKRLSHGMGYFRTPCKGAEALRILRFLKMVDLDTNVLEGDIVDARSSFVDLFALVRERLVRAVGDYGFTDEELVTIFQEFEWGRVGINRDIASTDTFQLIDDHVQRDVCQFLKRMYELLDMPPHKYEGAWTAADDERSFWHRVQVVKNEQHVRNLQQVAPDAHIKADNYGRLDMVGQVAAMRKIPLIQHLVGDKQHLLTRQRSAVLILAHLRGTTARGVDFAIYERGKTEFDIRVPLIVKGDRELPEHGDDMLYSDEMMKRLRPIEKRRKKTKKKKRTTRARRKSTNPKPAKKIDPPTRFPAPSTGTIDGTLFSSRNLNILEVISDEALGPKGDFLAEEDKADGSY